MEPRRDHALLYDGDCGFCRLATKLALRLDEGSRLRAVAIGSEEGRRLLTEVPSARRLDAFHLVTPGGIVMTGPDAAPALARLLRGGGVPARAMRRYPAATAATYRLIARHRGTLGRLGIRARSVD
jgi:predicted DCC family thiol-disulfide oxidoreductase YuxK